MQELETLNARVSAALARVRSCVEIIKYILGWPKHLITLQLRKWSTERIPATPRKNGHAQSHGAAKKKTRRLGALCAAILCLLPPTIANCRRAPRATLLLATCFHLLIPNDNPTHNSRQDELARGEEMSLMATKVICSDCPDLDAPGHPKHQSTQGSYPSNETSI